MTCALYNFQAGQFKKYGEKSLTGICKELYNETYQEYFENFQKHQLHPVAWETCPYPKGPNAVKNYVLDDFGKFLPPMLPGSDKWKFEARWLNAAEEIIGGYNAYVIVRNQESILRGKRSMTASKVTKI